MWHVTRDIWHVTHDTWHPPNHPPTHTHPTPNLGGCEEDLSNERKGLLHRGQTRMQTDIATLWLNRPSGPIQWKLPKKSFFLSFRNMVLDRFKKKELKKDKSCKKNIKEARCENIRISLPSCVFLFVCLGSFVIRADIIYFSKCSFIEHKENCKAYHESVVGKVSLQKIPHTGDTDSLNRCGS